jgi:hypothetical protein
MLLGNDESQSLFMTSDLTMMHYTGYQDDDEVQGILFMYKDLTAVYALEQIFDRRGEIKVKQRETFESFRVLLCEVMLAIQEQRHHNEVSKRNLMQYCQTVSLEQIMKKQDLFQAFATSEEEAVTEIRMQEAMNQMRMLEISMGSEIKPVGELKVSVLKRVVQVHGDLFEYNPLEDQNMIRVKDVFLCVD